MTARLGPSLSKETRALLPAFAASIVALAAVSPTRSIGFDLGPGLYFLAAATLGALSIGHEYLRGTLPVLLSQPVPRRRIWLSKLAVLAVMLAALLAFAWWSWGPLPRSTDVFNPQVFAGRLTLLLFPVLCGLFVAPWLTLVFRSPLAGIVFTAALPIVIGIINTLVVWSALRSGAVRSWPDFLHLLASVARWTTVALCLVAAVAGWRLFGQLEAIDGDGPVVQLPRWLRRGTTTSTESVTRPVLWRLVAKELRLQQMTIVVAGLGLAGMVGVRMIERAVPAFPHQFVYPITVLQLVLLPTLAGSLASAEERRLGTIEWQTLLPFASWKQWAVKIGVASLVSLTGAIALPLAVKFIDPAFDIVVSRGAGAFFPWSAAAVALILLLGSVYVSSLSSTGLSAIVAFIPVAIALLMLSGLVSRNIVADQLFAAIVWLERFVPTDWPASRYAMARTAGLWLARALCAGAILVLLRSALVNHRSAERGVLHAWRQWAAVGSCLALALVVQAVAPAIYVRGFARYTPEQRAALSASAVRRAKWQHELEQLTAGFNGRVGVCAADDISEACVHGEQPFPMQSVMKLPVAIAVLDAVDRDQLRLDDPVVVRKEDLSVFVQPIAKLVGPNGFATTLDDLLKRAIIDSDNACADILMARVGGAAAVQAALNRLALVNVMVNRDEKHLQSEIVGLEWRAEYLDPATFDRAIAAVPAATRESAWRVYLRDTRDTATPRGMAFLLQRLARGHILSAASTAHLLDVLRQTTTSPDRLKAGVPEGWAIGHKTGTSGDWNGSTAATNDVGVITTPDGRVMSLVVFIADSRAPAVDRAALMAKIARATTAIYR